MVEYKPKYINYRFIFIEGMKNDIVECLTKKVNDIKLESKRKPARIGIRDLSNTFHPPLSFEEQFEFLNHIPNNHYEDYLQQNCKFIAQRNRTLENHLLYNPKNLEQNNHNNAPTSFRQRCLYYLFFVEKQHYEYVISSIRFKLSRKYAQKRQQMVTPKPKRKRKRKNLKANNSPGISPQPVQNLYKINEGYDIFLEQMVHSGKLIVRHMSKVGGRLIMNSFDKKNGTMLIDNFVILTYSIDPTNSLDLECVCRDFKRTAGEGGIDLDPENTWMSKKTRCMHVRLLYEHLEESIKNLPDVAVTENDCFSTLKKQLKETSLNSANEEIVVVSNDNYLVLSVSFKPGDLPVFVKIHSSKHDTTSMCRCTKRVIKNIPNYWLEKRYVRNCDGCVHIQAVAEQSNMILKYLQEKRRKKIRREEKMESFSKEEGRWISASLLKHKPKNRGDESYHK